VKLPAESEVTEVGVIPGAVPPQVTVTAEFLAKLLPETVLSPTPLEGARVIAAAAAGALDAVKARLATEKPENAALSAAAMPPTVKETVLPAHEPLAAVSSRVKSYCPSDTDAEPVAVSLAQVAEATTAVPFAAEASSKVTEP